jgi:hypothetical protein
VRGRAIALFFAPARALGVCSATCVVVLGLAYTVVLAVGLLTLDSARDPIRDPIFSILEFLIVTMMPAMVLLMVSVHDWAPPLWKSFSFASVIIMGMLACVTSALHVAILTVSSAPDYVAFPLRSLFFSFNWPSIPYALDILGWDVFFALSMFLAAPVFGGSRLTNCIRILMITSGILALAGLSGPILGDMRFRMIGVLGYAVVFPIVAILLGILFYQNGPTATVGRGQNSV